MNKVTRQQVTEDQALDAIRYLWGTGATMQMRSDDQQYTEVLVRYAAERIGVVLE